MAQSPQEKLYLAVKDNKVDAIKRLIKQGVDVDIPFAKKDDDNGYTALSVAAILGHVQARLLLDALLTTQWTAHRRSQKRLPLSSAKPIAACGCATISGNDSTAD
ncbi:MAG: ankyrin repeat domain-containing protein [Pirellulaceae bacterium]